MQTNLWHSSTTNCLTIIWRAFEGRKFWALESFPDSLHVLSYEIELTSPVNVQFISASFWNFLPGPRVVVLPFPFRTCCSSFWSRWFHAICANNESQWCQLQAEKWQTKTSASICRSRSTLVACMFQTKRCHRLLSKEKDDHEPTIRLFRYFHSSKDCSWIVLNIIHKSRFLQRANVFGTLKHVILIVSFRGISKTPRLQGIQGSLGYDLGTTQANAKHLTHQISSKSHEKEK